ncbi:MAG TPA: hypothetical protein VF070_13185 [Streptosporangiaceae bacterium]
MTALTKTAASRINAQIRELQRERNATLAGRYLPWGYPWCRGPASPYHQEPVCEGCGGRLLVQDEAASIAEQIRQLQESLAPAVQGVLW